MVVNVTRDMTPGGAAAAAAAADVDEDCVIISAV